MSVTPRPEADFMPNRGTYTELKPFRFWCQKVLPLVYDDSLSYYELLCKVVDYLEKAMEDVDTLEGDVTAMYTAYGQLQDFVNNYFNSLDLQEEINTKMDALAASGELSTIIQPTVSSTTQEWLTQHITQPTTPVIDSSLTVGGAAADAKVTGDKITALKNDLINANLYDLRADMNHYTATWNGITFTWDGDRCVVTGTATDVTYNNIFISADSLPQNIHAGDILRVEYGALNVSLIFYDYSGGNISLLKEIKRNAIVKIPDTCTGLIIRLWIARGTTVNEIVTPNIYINNSCVIESVDTATASESGKTDMKYIIQEMLDLYGYCKLSPGAFYISGTVIIPEYGTLEGCGESTQVYLTSGNSKAAIQLRRYGAVRDLSLIGSYTDLTESDFGTSSGSRYGIQYYHGSSDPWTPACSSISNVFIKNFTAGGIYQYGTGGNVKQGLFVTDVHIENCWCGIWIYANSEFCRYENVQITYCYIACINNGGNNAFNNCVFHAYSIGMKIDGTQNNSAHGMCSNSSFCHTGNNTGSALTLSDIAHGFIFNANQFWYNSIDISRCGGVAFTGCEFGRGTTGSGATINVSGGNTIMFNSCVFLNDVTYPPVITVTNNSKVKFNACYGSVSGNEITA